MRDVLNKAVSLGIGLAVASKEQVEKIVDELVKKGEMSRPESLAFVDEWLKKGEESRQKNRSVHSGTRPGGAWRAELGDEGGYRAAGAPLGRTACKPRNERKQREPR